MNVYRKHLFAITILIKLRNLFVTPAKKKREKTRRSYGSAAKF